MSEPMVQIVDQLDVYGARWSRRVRFQLPMTAETGKPDTYLNGNLPVEAVRKLWHDLGVALDTIDQEEKGS